MTRVKVNRAAEVQARQIRMLALEEHRAARLWGKLFNSYAAKFGDAYATGGALGLRSTVDDFSADVRIALEANWNTTAEMFAGQTTRILSKVRKVTPSTGRPRSGLYEVKARKQTLVQAAVAEWVARYAGEKVVSITNTATAKFKAVIEEGTNKGWSNERIAKEIEKQFKKAAPYDSMRIARTETHGAAMAGSDAGARATGLEMRKQWLAAGDARTRPAHIAADGQEAEMNGSFIVDGERLAFPGDPGGSAANVIQCRCTVLYIPKE